MLYFLEICDYMLAFWYILFVVEWNAIYSVLVRRLAYGNYSPGCTSPIG